MPEINYNPSYSYDYSPSATTTNNYYVSASTKAAEPINMRVSSEIKNVNVTGNLPYDTPQSKGIAKKVLKKVISPFRKLRANHIIMISILALTCASRGMFSSNSKLSQSVPANQTEAAYQRGMQHIRDSIKIANLEKELKLSQDSVKLLKKAVK